MSMKLCSHIPANNWQEAFPLGNGKMGIMCYGSFPMETLELSENTFYSGDASGNSNQEGAEEAFNKMRILCQKEKFEEAAATAAQFIGIRNNYGTNLPVGKLKLFFCLKEQEDGLKEYQRKLNLEYGIFETKLESTEGVIQTEAFTSHPAKLFAMKIVSSQKCSFSISFDGGNNQFQVDGNKNVLDFEVKALEKIHSDGTTGVSLLGRCQVFINEGKLYYSQSKLFIEDTKEAVIYVAMETDFNKTLSKKLLKKQMPIGLETYELLKREHIKDFGSIMGRVSLKLTDNEIDEMILEEHLLRIKGEQKDNYLSEFLFQYGRYLLLSSSREDSELPAHLQGIWNDNVACRIGWTCDMHLDINTQMNYWLSEPANLSDSHKSLFRWMEQYLIPSGRITAKKSYGLRGWSADLVSNAWGFSAPYWSNTISPCPTGGIWVASDYVEHYRYTKDKNFLVEHAFPVISEAVDFFEEYIFDTEDGFLTAGPSISPENAFIKDGEVYYFSNGSTYEIIMIRELFLEYLELCHEMELLGNLTEKEKVREKRIKQKVSKLIPYHIEKDGTLAEWCHQYSSSDSQHRHTSHLLGLFPYRQITTEDTPELAEAAEQSLVKKMTPEKKWEDTGWARSLLILYSARLKKPEQAYKNLMSLQRNLMNPNLMVKHPPTRGASSFMDVYELDGNTGASMGILEMLIQSNNDEIWLLPCNPKEWDKGSLSGVVAKGNIIISMEWNEKKVKSCELYAEEECERKVYCNGREYRLLLETAKVNRLEL